jgi:PIN domain nuclease of toxin-antitoxin system
VFVSAASAWEIEIKVRARKLTVPESLLSDFSGVLVQAGFDPLPINIAHAICAGKLPGDHRDPFDRERRGVLNRMALRAGPLRTRPR